MRKLAVLSGKGGVGKTSVTVNLALSLAELGQRVGIVDCDVYGPNVPSMLGLRRTKPAKSLILASETLPQLRPIEVLGVKVVSPQFLISEGQVIALHADYVRMLLRRLLGADWGELDWLLIDTPPGTGDIHQFVLRRASMEGLIVVTPHRPAHLDARKLLTFARLCNLPLIGAVENMAGFTCAHCGELNTASALSLDDSIWQTGIEKLASIPLSQRMLEAGDQGLPASYSGDEQVAETFRLLAREVLARDSKVLDSREPGTG